MQRLESDPYPEPDMFYDSLNSLHLWLCAQPANFVPDPGTSLTPSQEVERTKLARQAYFGRRPTRGPSTLDLQLPEFDAPCPPGRLFPVATEPNNVGLGALDRLPPETLNNIISLSDLPSLDKFKAVNKLAYELVSGHTQLRVIYTQAYEVIRGLHAIKVAHRITLGTIFEVLCTSKCNECDDYGGYVYLVTFERVCGRCYMEKDRYIPLRRAETLEKFGLTVKILRKLPKFQAYKGSVSCRSRHRMKSRPRPIMVDRQSAHDAAIIHHGSLEAMQAYIANLDPYIWKSLEEKLGQRRQEEANRTAVYSYRSEQRRQLAAINTTTVYIYPTRRGGANGATSIDDSSDDENLNDNEDFNDNENFSDDDDYVISSETSKRILPIQRVPWLNRKSRREEWGFYCVGCSNNTTWPEQPHQEYIMSTFREHLKICGPIKHGVHHTDKCCKQGTCEGWKRDPFLLTTGEPYWRC